MTGFNVPSIAKKSVCVGGGGGRTPMIVDDRRCKPANGKGAETNLHDRLTITTFLGLGLTYLICMTRIHIVMCT